MTRKTLGAIHKRRRPWKKNLGKKTITEKNQSNKFSVQMKLLNIDKMTDIQKNLSINCFEIKQDYKIHDQQNRQN